MTAFGQPHVGFLPIFSATARHSEALVLAVIIDNLDAIDLDVDPMLLDFVDEVVGAEGKARTGR